MKRPLRGFAALLIVMVSAVCAWGEGSPVVMTHTLTGYSKGANTVTLDYAVQVVNREDATVGPIALSLAVRPPFVIGRSTVKVDSLPPKGTAEIKVKVVSRLLRDEKFFAHQPLLWAGKYSDANGKMVEFPVKSKPGGAK